MKTVKYFFLLLLAHIGYAHAQNNVAAIHLNTAPDPISTAMGSIGVASEPEECAQFWNPSKLVFIPHHFSSSLSFAPSSFGKKMYLACQKQIADNIAVGLGLNYYSIGSVDLKDEIGTYIGKQTPNEFGLDISFSKKFGIDFSMGATVRYIKSDIFDLANNGKLVSASAAAMDIGAFYKRFIGEDRLSFGAMISNIGTKVNYGGNVLKFLPLNFRIGANYSTGTFNQWIVGFEISKLLVGTNELGKEISPTTGITSAFTGRLKNYEIGIGTEYNIRSLLMLRAGFNIQNRESFFRKNGSIGLGFAKNNLRINASYLVPIAQKQFLDNKFKISIGLAF